MKKKKKRMLQILVALLTCRRKTASSSSDSVRSVQLALTCTFRESLVEKRSSSTVASEY